MIIYNHNKQTDTTKRRKKNVSICGIIKDAARAIEKYDKEEAKALLSFLEWGIDEYNTPFVKAANSDGGYFFEYEEVPCATKYNEETDEAEYKEGYHNYFCIRFVR